MAKFEKVRIIHVDWDGPISLEQARKRTDTTDYGVYQIYGGHPVYGSGALIYIGCAVRQHFGERLKQEQDWEYNRDAQRVEIYLGRLSGKHSKDYEDWDNDIVLAERLLIYAHLPPYNRQANLAAAKDSELRNVQVLNWGCHRDLLPEVSGARWTSRFYEFPTEHFSDG